MTSRPRRALGLGAALTRPLPISVLSSAGDGLGRIAARLQPAKRAALAENLSCVIPDAPDDVIAELTTEAFGSYGRYWAETFRLPSLATAVIERNFDVEGYHHIQRSLARGVGPIMVLPHLGGWEWAAAWLGRVAELPVSAVVEPLEPPDVYEWFRTVRESYGVNVIPLGPNAMGEVVSAVGNRHVVCLLADRDLGDSGVEVTFFGSRTTLPVGPALLARRTGAPLLPTGVYFTNERGGTHWCRISEPIEARRTGRLRADVAATTQEIAHALERVIERAPTQWHVLEPIW